MPRIYLPTVSPEDKVALICLLVLIVLWVVWIFLMNSPLADRWQLFEYEDRLWRKHGITVPGLFFMVLMMIGVLYMVWLMLGQL